MLKVKNHIIKSLCFDIQVSDEAVAVEFGDKLRIIDCGLLMNNIFKKYDNINETIRLDRIELDIGTVERNQMGNIGAEISRQLEDILDKVLGRKINRVALTTEEVRDSGDTSLQEIKSVETDIEVLIHYLKSGSLPWNIVYSPDMEELLLNILNREPAKLRMAIIHELGSSIVRKRIQIVFSPSTLKILLAKLIDEDGYRLIENFSAVVTGQISVSQISDFEKELAAISLSCIFISVHQKQDFISVFIARIQPLLNIFPLDILKALHMHIRETIHGAADVQLKYFYESVSEILVQIIKTKKVSHKEKFFSSLSQASKLKVEPETVKSVKQDILLKNEKTEKREEQPDENEEQQYYFIDNAGLVLLNQALLLRSFEQMGWVKDKKIADDHSRNKILMWLDYLVWGQRSIHEYSLILNKLLTGMHPSEVADIHVSLTGKEKKAADEFLETVIEYWSLLKNTSSDGLRTSFLQRNGRLVNEEGGWQLHVESKGIDILIENLPWPFSIIKSPWMDKPLFTQWSTRV